jgi:hypothetical protein
LILQQRGKTENLIDAENPDMGGNVGRAEHGFFQDRWIFEIRVSP